MRQFYLLLGECYAQQKVEDQRCYRLICCWVKDPPEFGVVFPLWAEDVGLDEDDDPVSSFHRVTSYLKTDLSEVNGRHHS